MNRLAIRMLLGDRAKYLGIVFGVMLAALLMSHQVTIFVGLMSRTRSIFQQLPGVDLIITDPATEFVEDVKPLSDTALQRVRSADGVAWAVPMMRQPLRVRTEDGRFRTCIIVGLDDASLIGGPSVMHAGSVEALRTPDSVIIDRIDATKLLSSQANGRIRVPAIGDFLEINDRRVRIAGISDNPRPFISQPIIYTTLSTSQRIAPVERRTVSFVLAGLRAGFPPEAGAASIRAATGLEAFTRRGFGWRTIGYYLRNTGIPVNFGVTVLLGCIVGIAISGQTFYLFTLDNLKNLAALKAMGATTRQLIRMLLLQAAVVGAQGYAIGIGLTAVFFIYFMGTDLAFDMHWEVLLLTAAAVMLVIASAVMVSLRAVLKVQPALVFRG